MCLSYEVTKEEIEESAQVLRDLATVSNDLGTEVIALVAAVVGSVLLVLVHRPNQAHMLERWPGTVLAFRGAVSLIVGYALNSAVPGVLKNEAVES